MTPNTLVKLLLAVVFGVGAALVGVGVRRAGNGRERVVLERKGGK